MTLPSLELSKIWEDEYFFELVVEARSPHCQMDINIYTTNEELEELKDGFVSVSSLKASEHVWTGGDDKANVTHYLRFRTFLCSKRGHVAIEISTDNKREIPYSVKTQFSLFTELGSLDDFINQLDKLIQGKTNSAKGIEYTEF